MARVIRWIEVFAGYSIGVVALLTFFEALLRYVFRVQIPDAYSFAGLLQAVAVFWGISTATYAGRHITVDILWEALPKSLARWIDVFAGLVSLLFFGLLSVMLFRKILISAGSSEATNQLHVPLWIFIAAAAIGVFAATFLNLVRIFEHLRSATRVKES
ncbi:TRAP transporter small permease subunit [Maritimibacter sp. DP07]|uniref:TRAP transporter small permease protein n=1 Tax=Maritimibacter harenae TaxID=2606218 RepID=A0A845LY57_9RHOB|nr:TRAP transporter small permease [Maritimibacter harenae]MZR11702.1 TRAP transporter small permease subunit [Maritimibacter harenae]